MKNHKKGAGVLDTLVGVGQNLVKSNPELVDAAESYIDKKTGNNAQSQPQKITLPSEAELQAILNQQGQGRRKTKKLRRKFDKCVKAVRKTVKARRGSTKKQAAYAICTKSILKGRVRT